MDDEQTTKEVVNEYRNFLPLEVDDLTISEMDDLIYFLLGDKEPKDIHDIITCSPKISKVVYLQDITNKNEKLFEELMYHMLQRRIFGPDDVVDWLGEKYCNEQEVATYELMYNV